MHVHLYLAQILHRPPVLAHGCAHEATRGFCAYESDPDPPPLFDYYYPWNYEAKNVTTYPEAARLIRTILDLCGLYHKVATRGDVFDKDPILGCGHPTCCPKNNAEVTKFAFRWAGALQHALKEHPDDLEDFTFFRLLEGEDAEHAQECEFSTVRAELKITPFSCKHCASGSKAVFGWMSNHLLNR